MVPDVRSQMKYLLQAVSPRWTGSEPTMRVPCPQVQLCIKFRFGYWILLDSITNNKTKRSVCVCVCMYVCMCVGNFLAG